MLARSSDTGSEAVIHPLSVEATDSLGLAVLCHLSRQTGLYSPLTNAAHVRIYTSPPPRGGDMETYGDGGEPAVPITSV